MRLVILDQTMAPTLINFNKMKELSAFRRWIVEEEVNEVEPQTDLIGIAAHTLKDMNAEEAIDAIDRLMLYLKDAKADIEYKNK